MAVLLTTLALMPPLACGSGSAEDLGADYGGPNGTGGGSAGATSGAGGGIPPEEELESSYGAPVATGKYVWIPNPTSGRVAYIDAATLEIRVVEAGHAPTFIAPVPDPDDDVAIVLNVLSRDATLLRDDDGELSALSLPVPSSGNAWAVSPDGRWAVAWTDGRLVEGADPIDGYQDVTVLDLARGAERSTALTVGYRPVAVAFDAASETAFAVTQDGISVIDLDASEPVVTRNVKLSDDPIDDTSTRDVSITKDGAYALVRREDDPTIGVFTLADGARSDVTLSAPATDLDLSADGSVAVVVVRSTSEVALLPIPSIAADPTAFTVFTVSDGVVGSAALALASPMAFLYTNAVPSPLLTVFDSSDPAPTATSILLRAPLQAVFPTPDAAHAVVLHDAFEVQGGSKYPAALSLVPVAADLPAKIVGLASRPVSVAIAPAGDRALVAIGAEGEATFAMVVARLPSLQVDTYALASRPIAAGIVAGAHRGFVAQEHPDGRITFVDFVTGEIRTLTGFELASQVITGSKQ